MSHGYLVTEVGFQPRNPSHLTLSLPLQGPQRAGGLGVPWLPLLPLGNAAQPQQPSLDPFLLSSPVPRRRNRTCQPWAEGAARICLAVSLAQGRDGSCAADRVGVRGRHGHGCRRVALLPSRRPHPSEHLATHSSQGLQGLSHCRVLVCRQEAGWTPPSCGVSIRCGPRGSRPSELPGPVGPPPRLVGCPAEGAAPALTGEARPLVVARGGVGWGSGLRPSPPSRRLIGCQESLSPKCGPSGCLSQAWGFTGFSRGTCVRGSTPRAPQAGGCTRSTCSQGPLPSRSTGSHQPRGPRGCAQHPCAKQTCL